MDCLDNKKPHVNGALFLFSRKAAKECKAFFAVYVLNLASLRE